MRINKAHHHFDRRSSLSGSARSDAALPSSIAKYALALRRISLAWRSSRFPRSSAFIRSASSVIASRKDLDTDAGALARFDALTTDFDAWRGRIAAPR
jgi:hypothetical protein